MKTEIKINVNDLETFIAALNNAIIAYNDIRERLSFLVLRKKI